MVFKKERAGLFLVLATAFISGFSVFFNKLGMGGINPFIFTTLKNLLVAFFLFSAILGIGHFKALKKLKLKEWGALFLIGLLGGSLAFLLFFKGLTMTSAAQASFLHKGMFILAAPLAFLFLKERLEKNFLIAAIFLLGGNLLFFRLTEFSFRLGDFLILGATLLWAIEGVLAKKILVSISSQVVAFGRMFFGSILMLSFLIFTGQFSLIGQLRIDQMAWVFLTSLFLLGYVTTWYAGLKRTRLSLATSVLTLGAPVTTFLSVAFLNGGFSPWQIGGSFLLVLGIIFLTAFEKKSFHAWG